MINYHAGGTGAGIRGAGIRGAGIRGIVPATTTKSVGLVLYQSP